MSFDLLRSAKHIRGLSHAEFRVLFYLLEAANNKDRKCFPSIRKIAKFTDMAERTVQRHISALADRGLFKRIEQRRDDGSRMVNCYQFIIQGSVRIGRESVVVIGPDEDDGEDLQPAKTGRLDNPPFLAPPPVGNDTTPRQSRQGLYKDLESEPGIRTDSNDYADHDTETDLFGQPIKTPEQMAAERRAEAIRVIEEGWAQAMESAKGIAALRGGKLDDTRAEAAIQRAQKFMVEGETEADVWRAVFEKIQSSFWLCGGTRPRDDRPPFRLQMTWLLENRNFTKVLEGKFDDGRDPTQANGTGPRRYSPGGAVASRIIERNLARRHGRPGGGNRSRAIGS